VSRADGGGPRYSEKVVAGRVQSQIDREKKELRYLVIMLDRTVVPAKRRRIIEKIQQQKKLLEVISGSDSARITAPSAQPEVVSPVGSVVDRGE
jgi:hypothetical protein